MVGKNVKLLRKAKGLTQEELAHHAKIDTRYVGGIERGLENPSLAVLGRIAAVLDVHPAELLADGVTKLVEKRSPSAEP